MCSMKWATPASPAVSRREPARTYAAMETERAPGNRELITRGPEGSAVRSNIAADGTGTRATARGPRIDTTIPRGFTPDSASTTRSPRCDDDLHHGVRDDPWRGPASARHRDRWTPARVPAWPVDRGGPPDGAATRDGHLGLGAAPRPLHHLPHLAPNPAGRHLVLPDGGTARAGPGGTGSAGRPAGGVDRGRHRHAPGRRAAGPGHASGARDRRREVECER